MIKNLNISQKLALMTVPAIIALLLILMAYRINNYKVYEDTKKIYYTELYKIETNLLNADRDFYQAEQAQSKLQLLKDKDSEKEITTLVEAYKLNMNQVNDGIEAALEAAKNNKELYDGFTNNTLLEAYKAEKITLQDDNYGASDLTFLKEMQAFQKDLKTWNSLYDVETGLGDYNAKEKTFDATRNHLSTIKDYIEAYSVYSTNHMETKLDANNNIATSIIAIVIIMIVLISIYNMNYIRKNINMLTKDMDALAKNNLTIEPFIVNSKDELGILSRSTNTLLVSLKEIITLLNTSAVELTDSSDQMNYSSNEITKVIEEIAYAVNDIAQTISEQASSTEQVSNEILSLEKVMDESNQSAMSLADASEQINGISHEGMEVVNELSEITKQNQESFDIIFSIIEKINESTIRIGSASKLISDIAEQTNLLSLNASIEAARAGEAGKGFSVVAEEIRKLSEESSNSSNVIDHMLKELQDNVRYADQQSELVKKAVENQVGSVEETKSKYVAIVDTIKNINKEINSLDTISGKMGQSCSNVVKIIAALSIMAQDNAAATEQTSASTEEILATMISITNGSDSVRKQAQELNDIIQNFKL